MNEARSALPDDTLTGIRRLPIPALIGIIVVYLAIVQGAGWLLSRGDDADYATFRTTGDVWKHLIGPTAIAFAFVAIVITWLGWWRPVITDRRPVPRWVWVVPAIMVAAILAGMYYGALADKGVAFTASFILGALLVGLGEEGMFRGIAVTAYRVDGFAEVRVALWTCVLFGLAHGTNVFIEGPQAIIQVLVTAVAGFFFYLTRRVAGGIWLAVLIHAFWDFSLFTGSIREDYTYPGTFVFFAVDIVLVIILIARRRSLGLGGPAPTAPAQPAT